MELLLHSAIRVLAQQPQSGNIPQDITGWGAAGLGGLILCWLFFWHLPSKDKQLADKDKLLVEQLDKKDTQIKDMMKEEKEERERERSLRHEQSQAFQKAIADTHNWCDREALDARKEFKEALNLIVQHCEKESNKVLEALKTEIGRVVVTIERQLGDRKEPRGAKIG